MPDVAVGYYRHWKGGLYEVEIAKAEDANATDWEFRSAFHVDEPYFPDGRHVVVYRSIADGTYWVRTVEDFTAVVHTEDGSTCAGELCNRIVGKAFANRFTYLGTELTGEMLSE